MADIQEGEELEEPAREERLSLLTVTGRISASYVIVSRILPPARTQREGTPHNRESHILQHQAHDIGQISLCISEHELEGQCSKLGMLSSSRCFKIIDTF